MSDLASTGPKTLLFTGVISDFRPSGVLSDSSIVSEIAKGHLVISGFRESHIQPSSYDVTVQLEEALTLYPVGVRYLTPYLWARLRGRNVCRGFCLLSTKEWFELPANIQGQVHGRSSLGRLGLVVHFTAGFIDPGFKGTITLECMAFDKPVMLCPDDRVGQINFQWLDRPAAHPYDGRYQNQIGPTQSRFQHRDQ